MQPGRNDPCSCGSGKKFKKCCLMKQVAPADLLWHRLRTIHDELVHRLSDHARSEFGEESIKEAWDEFWLWDEESPELDPGSPINQLFGPFYLYNWYREEEGDPPWTAPESRTVANDYLRVRGSQLSELERRFIEASIQAPFSFHELIEVSPGDGFVLKDIFLGTSATVIEKMGSQAAQIGDLYFGKVVQVDHVAMLCGSGWVLLPPTSKNEVLELRKRIRSSLARESRELDSKALHQYDVDLRMYFLEMQEALLTPPTLTNTDGDMLALHRITYEVSSAQEAFDALKSLSLMMNEQEILESATLTSEGSLQRVSFAWHKRGNKLHKQWDNTVLGHLEIEGAKLTIEVNSAQRAKKIKAEVKKRLGKQAKHLGTVVQSPESMAQEKKQPQRPEDLEREALEEQELLKDPHVLAQIREMMKSHWENWYREKIPALGNRTPLQAAKSEEGRELLESLLIEYGRRGGERDNPLLRPDFAELRRRLGLPGREGENE